MKLTLFNKLSIRWRITITIAVLMFFIFTLCNSIQLGLIQRSVMNQQEHRIEKRLKETSAYLDEEYKTKRPNASSLVENKTYFEKIIQNNEMIRLLNKDGKVIFTVSRTMPKIHINKNAFDEIQKYRLHNQEILITSKSLKYKNFDGVLEVAMNVEIFSTIIKESFMIIIFGTVISLILSMLSGYFLSRRILNPIKNLNQTMTKIKNNNQIKERVFVGETKDELAELGLLFNKMMDELESSITRQKRFVEDASHELRTPLAIIHGHLSLVNRWGKKDETVLENSLNTCINETNRMIILTNELLQLTKLEKNTEKIEQYAPTNLNEVLNEIKNNYQMLHEDLEIHISTDKVVDRANIAREHLMQILIILFDNAVKYGKDHVIINIAVSQAANKIEIKVQDNGIGIKKEDINHIFDRFYRADKARSRANGGNGLGLSIAKNLIGNYGGDLNITSKNGEGTTATITLKAI